MVTACIDNPFGTTSAPCPAADYVDVQQRYCSNTSTVNAWLSGCTTYTNIAEVSKRRAEICIDDLAFNAGTVDVPVAVAAGDSLFSERCNGLDNGEGETVANQRIAVCTTPATTFKTGCVTTGEHDESAGNTVLAVRKTLTLDCLLGGIKNPTDGVLGDDCKEPIAGDGGTISVAECNRNPYLKTDNCNTNDAFVDRRMSRDSTCNNPGSSFDSACDIEGESATQEDAATKIRVARGRACLDGYTEDGGATPALCGNENTNGDYIAAYCNDPAQVNNIANCPMTYATANPVQSGDVANVALLTSKALNAEGQELLTILEKNTTSDTHAAANFIQGDNASLNLANGNVSTENNALLTLGALEDPTRQTEHGFALGSSFHTSGQKLYVGLLAGTDLGAPLADTAKNGVWKTIARVIDGTTLQAQTEQFTLTVNFDTNASTIVTGADAPVIGSLGVIDIDGKFTNNGVIYGTVSFANSGAGTLTGLIGTNGAVGIFASNSAATTAYVGGFVAERFDSAVDCVADADPFNPLCGDNQTAQISYCEGTSTPNDILCNGRKDAVCGTADSGGSKIFAMLCGTNTVAQDNFCNNDATESDIDCGNGGYTATICETTSATNVFADLCTPANREAFCTTGTTTIFDDSCKDGTHGEVDKARALVCQMTPDVNPVDADGNEITNCGDENNAGYIRTYCQTPDGMGDGNNCPITVAALNRGACEANPWGTVPENGADCDANTYYTNRLAFCAPGAVLPAGAPQDACATLAEITCKNGGTGITADPFHENCFVGDTYANDRATACRDNTQGTGDCNTTEIETAVCADSGDHANPFATFCGDELGTSRSGTIEVVKQNFCGGTPRTAAHSVNECNGLLDALCSDAASVTTVGAANYNCLMDTTTNVVAARVGFCETPATTYTTGCTTAIGNVLAVRRQLALSCSGAGSGGNGCGQLITATGTITVATCSANPFLTTDGCNTDTGFDTERTTRRALCTTAGATFAPFDSKCNPATATDATYLSNVETARDSYCADTAGFEHLECGTTGRTTTICTDTDSSTLATKPFATLCGGNDGSTTTDAQAAACRVSSSADGGTCGNTIMAFCGSPASPSSTTANLFDTALCDSTFDIVRGRACLDGYTEGGSGSAPALCGNENTAGNYIYAYCQATGLTNLADCPATYATMNGDAAEVSVAAFKASGQNKPLNSDGSAELNVVDAGGANDTNDATTNFIELGADGTLLTTGTNPSESPSGDSNGTGLTLADDGVNGFAFARNNNNKLYVGLLANTNLGGPLRSDNATNATWDAKLRVLYFNGTDFMPEEADFELQINYGDANRDNTLAIAGNDPSLTTLGAFSIVSGKFTNNGVIYGEVNFASNNVGAGTLTGLIGADGAIGIFKSNDAADASTSSIAYVGGFTAAPAAEVEPEGDGYATFKNHYAAQSGNTELLALADSSASSTTRGFLQGTATGLIETNLTFDSVAGFKSIAIKLGGNTGNENSPDGFAVVSSNNGIYAGLLSGTDLGAPLASQSSINVEWTGSLNYVASSSARGLSTSSDFTLTVNVNDGTLTSTAISIPSFATDGTMVINGRFGNHADASGLPTGVLGGSFALYNNGVLNQSRANEALIGLIGADGVLGVFHTAGLTGGFWASGDLPDGMEKQDDNQFDPTKPNFGTWTQAFKTAGDNNFVLPVDSRASAFSANKTYFVEGAANGFGLTNVPETTLAGNFTEAKNLLRLGTTDSGVIFWQGGIFIASDQGGGTNVGGVGLAGLLAGTDLGAPLDNNFVSAVWSGKIKSYVYGTLNDAVDFHLNIAYTGSGGTVRSITAASGGTEGAVPIDPFVGQGGSTIDISGSFTNAGVLSGNADLDSGSATGTFIGLIGADGAIGAFKDNGNNADFIGGFVVAKSATPPSTTCNPDMPFSDTNCDAVADATARLNEANRCYNNGGSRPPLGDCSVINECLGKTNLGLFSSSERPRNGIDCSGAAFAGARASYCGGNNIATSLCEVFIALDTAEAACITNPFTTGCDASLGADVAVTARTARVDYCVLQAIQPTTTTTVGSPCAGALTYCSDTTRSDTSECKSSATGNTALIPAFCGAFRNLSDGVCRETTQRTDSCDDNPFDTFCTEPGYITAQRTACGADDYGVRLSGFNSEAGRDLSPTMVNVAICQSLGHTTTLCAESGADANPFAMICTDTIATETLKTTQEGYCRGDGILEANPGNCGGVASAFCATAGTDNAVAFDNLCRDASYDEARVKACGAGTPNTSTYTVTGFTGCNDLVASLCPGNPGCPLSGDTVTTANWTSVLPGAGAVQADGSTRLDILSELGLDEDYTGYVQADADGLKLGAALLDAGGTRKTGVTYNGNILNLSDAGVVGDGGVAFALIDFTDFVANEVATGKERFYAGILDGTDVGAPLNNAEQSGTWSGMIALYNTNAGGLLSAEFDLTVSFNNGADGTLTASLTHSDLADATFTLNGNFTSAGIIYGTTSFGYTGFLSTGSLTGLIGAKGAVGAFVSSGAGNRSTAGEARNRNGEYAGGFVAKASEPTEVGTDCSAATGTPFDASCDNTVKLQLCGGTIADLEAADGGSLVACNTAELSGAICASTGASANPFAPICSQTTATAIISGFDQVAVQVAFCNANSDNSECVLPAWKLNARNSNDTGRLDVLAAVGNDDPDVNYVSAGADGLNLGFVEENGALKAGATVQQTTVRLSASAPTLDTTSGFAIAIINFDGFTNNSRSTDSRDLKQRYYAGILSGTDLGAPLVAADVSSDNTTATWSTRFAVLINNDLREFTGDLFVNFSGKTIATGNNGRGINTGSLLSHHLHIAGKFTNSGVIYGTTLIADAAGNSRDTRASGSVTGLIGREGAVGVFVGEGVLDGNASQYAGGFVAVNPNIAVDCTPESGNLFNLIACPIADNLQAQAEACETRNLVSPENGITSTACNRADIIPLLCAEDANPFDTLCFADNTYDVRRGKLCIDSSYRIPATGLAPTGCGNEATPDTYVAAYCGSPDGRADSANCEVAYCTYTDALDNACIAFCIDTATDNSGNPRCTQGGVLAITNACTLDPFAAVCEPYATEYQQLRNDRVATCRGDAAMRGATLCNRARRVICLREDTPFASVCNAIPGQWADQQTTLVNNCGGNDQHADCAITVSGELTVAGCVADPFNALCPVAAVLDQRDVVCESTTTSYTAGCLVPANGYTGRRARTATLRRATLLYNCTNDGRDKAGCDTVIKTGTTTTLTQCIDNPFLADCKGATLASALAASASAKAKRDAFVAGCSTGGTGCDTEVAGGLTITQCITMAFDARCSGGTAADAFAQYRAPICTTAATSFTAGCDEATYAGTDTARAELALSCAVASGGTGCGTIMVTSGKTINDCNANPFAAGCESPAFINARLESCKGGSPDADCSVADGQGYTNYVSGDNLQASAGATQTGGLTLAELEGNDDATAGFNLAYIPTGRATDTDVFGTDRFYAGLLSGTNVSSVGIPMTAPPTSGEWTAKMAIIHDGRAVETEDFTLNVDFAAKTLGASSTRTTITEVLGVPTQMIDPSTGALEVDALGRPVLRSTITTTTVNEDVKYVTIAGGQFTIAGKFTTAGVIYGTTRLTDGQLNGESSRGSLTGLIGEKGAVGVFVSSGEGVTVNTLGEFAGGFVATNPDYVFAPTPDNTAGVVSYADWVYGQELNSQERLSFTANTETLKNEFLAIRTGDDALDEAGLATISTTRRYSIDLTSIGRTVDGTGGFSIFTHGGFAYAGILPNTDLGAPLTSKDVETTWRGAFYAVGGYEIDQNGHDRDVTGPFLRPADFLLEITFGGTGADFGAIKGSFQISPASLASEARGNVYFLLDGTFNAGGYITGTVNFGKFDNGNLETPAGGRAPNGVLTGIIGKNGAVGAFISNPVPDNEPSTGDRNFIYSGGFAVARDNKPNYATFREFYTPRSDTRELHATHPATPDSGRFIEGTPTGLVTEGFDLGGNGYGPVVVRLGEVTSEHADYDSGFAVMRDTNNRYRVGLLSGTDLGAALDSTVKANWSGKIYRLTHTVRRGQALTSNDLTLTVDFANGTIKTTDATVNGRFRAGGRNTDLPFGILDGTVNYGSFNVLAGLIGEKGVLGVFHGGVNGLHAGGFYATPDEESVSYTFAAADTLYSAWDATFTNAINGGETRLDSGVDSFDIATFNGHYIKLDKDDDIVVLTEGNLETDTLMLDGSAAGGVVFGVESDGGQSFVSLLPTTNVGGAITSGPTTAIWRGSLKGISNYGNDILSSDSFSLEVAFGAGSHAGTIKTHTGTFNYTPITGGTFNVNGNFNADGVMWGTVGLGFSGPGVFSGLIGEHGAVGAFKGAVSGAGYAGGFQVKPPSN